MMTTCPICGIRRVIYWPEHWIYRRGETYYCGENCMQVDITHDMRMIKSIAHERAKKKGRKGFMGKLEMAQKARAVDMALRGESPIAYLKECGCANPSSSWCAIKKGLKKTNPETWAALPKDFRKKETPEQAPVIKLSGPLKIETPEAAKVEVVETPERKPSLIYKIRAIETGIGSWEYSEKYNWISFHTKDGKDEVMMTPAEWAQMLRDLPDVFRVLEVKRR